jgi:hypothetical protein
MEKKEDYKYKSLIIFVILISVILFGSLIFYLFLSPRGDNAFGNIKSYYLPVFSFGSSDFPPLEF